MNWIPSSFTMVSYTDMYQIHSKDFCALVIPKAWGYTILVETHDKMGHQGNNRMYSLIKRQYYCKVMAKDVNYIQRCPACQQSSSTIISITHDRNPRSTF